ncbi:hypothetical protein SEA_SERENITY_39 [Mycobacterium phage Serenity]|uniref:hypothetical protein n=1 Tax=Mycobacterium phage Serenity TaxID=1701853 RepID=UPI0006CE4817|nr:hypothetical protein SEA_SERENITY_39 [Mycobacterium phage Serenity]ALF00906.1 hypothetical protein SEA_SERENITY_39 [Mycobacterium phage Serenity]
MIDTDQQDHEFFDVLYQQWAKSTWAEHRYWMPERDDDENIPWQIFAVDQVTKERTWIGSVFNEADADFIAGLHGAVPDLIRRLHEAIDEATRKDEANDIAQGQLAEALLENEGLKAQILELERELNR